MTDARLRSLADELKGVGAEWLVVDGAGRVISGCRPVGEDVASWLPGWSPDGHSVARRSLDDRWVSLQVLHRTRTQRLYLVLDRTCELVVEEARLLSSRRRSQAELAGSTAREMNDAMTIVQGRLELLRAFALEDPEAADRHAAIALEHAQHAAETLHDLRLVGAVTPAEVGAVRVLDAARSGLEASRLNADRVQIDVHPADLEVLGREGPLRRVFTTALRAMGTGRESLSLTARRSGDVVRVSIAAAGRRRTDVDALQLGIIAALLDALGGVLSQTGAGIDLVLPADELDRIEGPSGQEGELLVVGHPYLADRVSRLLEGDAVSVRGEPTAEAALARVTDPGVVGLVTQLLLPERCGLALYRDVQRVRPDLPLGPLVVTADTLTRLPRDVRCVAGPLTRARLYRGLRA
ncbi:MAG: hypothetical protein R3F61_26520 [Myxococcota bacterium]